MAGKLTGIFASTKAFGAILIY
ncbi:hypothetical protein Patl1_32757 [Pistacia atlantica]|uniref:Uncharacterized protein n=1 Tax=Pistacia atlantica TaxID=434234 RepID=A0ACC1ANZ3_9ROSI|nr:hypothetical protein Patl1_32757 [Pistacia atlantica]